MRELLLLRHAKSAWNSDAPSDFERPLNQRGRSEAPRLGGWMRAQKLVPDAVFCSDATRARQTADRVLKGLDIDPDEIRYDHRLYLAPLGELLTFVQNLPARCERPLIIGHNPGLGDLVTLLCGAHIPRTKNGKLMTTACLARIGIAGHWNALKPCGGMLRDLIRARDIPAP